MLFVVMSHLLYLIFLLLFLICWDTDLFFLILLRKQLLFLSNFPTNFHFSISLISALLLKLFYSHFRSHFSICSFLQVNFLNSPSMYCFQLYWNFFMSHIFIHMYSFFYFYFRFFKTSCGIYLLSHGLVRIALIPKFNFYSC